MASVVLDGTTGAMVALDGTIGATVAVGVGTDGIDGTTGAMAAVGLVDGAGTTGVTLIIIADLVTEDMDMHITRVDEAITTTEIQFQEQIQSLQREADQT